MGKKGRSVKHIASFNFAREFCKELFRTNFGTNDGCLMQTRTGLTINSKTFTKTPDPGENNEFRANGWLDNFKQVLTTRHCYDVAHCRETVIYFNVAAAQFFCVDNPLPQAYIPRVKNMRGDPRLAHGIVFALNPETGMLFGFTITDHVIHAVYGRLPYARTREGCAWAVDCMKNECEPCKPCYSEYTCENFQNDCRYQHFKLMSRQSEWLQFMHFIRWREACGGNPYDWDAYGKFCQSKGALSCDVFTRDRWAKWGSEYDWTEYQYFVEWCVWREHEVKFGKMDSCRPKCEAGVCGDVVFYSLPSAVAQAKCIVDGCANCNACPPPAAEKPVTEYKRECYAYQWGAVRCCCDFQGASFLSLIEVARTESCEPLKDFHCLSIGIDRSHSTVNWMINNRVVHTHVGIGRRTAEEYRVRENGGYAEQVDVPSVMVGFGTGSILDASLPSNYWRFRAQAMDTVDSTALVPLLCESAYFNPYFNTLGELLPAKKNLGLAFATYGRTAQDLGLAPTDRQYRLFGQGAIETVREIRVFSRKMVKNPVYVPDSCDFSCYGPRPAECCGYGATSCKKRCVGGCCGENCDAPSSDCSDTEDDIYSALASAIGAGGDDSVYRAPTAAAAPLLAATLRSRLNNFRLHEREDCGNNCSDDDGEHISSINLYN